MSHDTAELRHEPFQVDPHDKADLFRRFDMVRVRIEGLVHTFRTRFDNQLFGTTSMIVSPFSHTVVSDEFYPFCKPWEGDFRRELRGMGLGTLAHTLVLLQILQELDEPSRWKMRHVSVSGEENKHRKSIDRMGNAESRTRPVPLLPYIDNAMAACRAIGFLLDEVAYHSASLGICDHR